MSFLSKAWFGIDLEEEQARGNELDKQLAEINARKLDSGKYTAEQYQQAELNRMAGATGDVTGQVSESFVEGAKEGAANVVTFATETVPGAVNATVSGAVGAVWKSIPMSVWLLAGAALFVWMGGLALLRGKLSQ